MIWIALHTVGEWSGKQFTFNIINGFSSCSKDIGKFVYQCMYFGFKFSERELNNNYSLFHKEYILKPRLAPSENLEYEWFDKAEISYSFSNKILTSLLAQYIIQIVLFIDIGKCHLLFLVLRKYKLSFKNVPFSGYSSHWTVLFAQAKCTI